MKRSKKTCAICIEGFEEEQIIKKLYCSHIFHRKCLKEWLKINKICPLCRSDLTNWYFILYISPINFHIHHLFSYFGPKVSTHPQSQKPQPPIIIIPKPYFNLSLWYLNSGSINLYFHECEVKNIETEEIVMDKKIIRTLFFRCTSTYPRKRSFQKDLITLRIHVFYSY